MTMFTISRKRRHTRQRRNLKAVSAATPNTHSDWSWWRSKNLGKRRSTQSWIGTNWLLKNWSWISASRALTSIWKQHRRVASPVLSAVLSPRLCLYFTWRVFSGKQEVRPQWSPNILCHSSWANNNELTLSGTFFSKRIAHFPMCKKVTRIPPFSPGCYSGTQI